MSTPATTDFLHPAAAASPVCGVSVMPAARRAPTMTGMARDETGRDTGRAVAVLAAAVLQVGAGAVGGTGLWGEAVGDVANSYPTLLLPPGAAFTIWSLIYVAFLALAVRQVLPGQRARAVHRRTGWWLAAAGLLNATWVLVFGQRWVVVAQVVIVALLVCLAVAVVRLTPAQGWGDRLLLHLPVTVYLGWVGVATVAGGATTTAAYGAAPGTASAVTALLLTGAAAAVAVFRLPAAAGFAASVCWALAWIAAGASVTSVRVAALAAVAAVVVTVGVRLWRGAGITALG